MIRLTSDPWVQEMGRESGNVQTCYRNRLGIRSTLSGQQREQFGHVDGWYIGQWDEAGNWTYEVVLPPHSSRFKYSQQLVWHKTGEPLHVVGDSLRLGSRLVPSEEWRLPTVPIPRGETWMKWEPVITGGIADRFMWLQRMSSTGIYHLARFRIPSRTWLVAPISEITDEKNANRRKAFHECYFDGELAYLIHSRSGPGFSDLDYDKRWFVIRGRDLEDGVQSDQLWFRGNHPTIVDRKIADTDWDKDGFSIGFGGAWESRDPIRLPKDHRPQHLHIFEDYLVASVDVLEDSIWTQAFVWVYDGNRNLIKSIAASMQNENNFQVSPSLARVNGRLAVFWHSDLENAAGMHDVYMDYVDDPPTDPPTDPVKEQLAVVTESYIQLGDELAKLHDALDIEVAWVNLRPL